MYGTEIENRKQVSPGDYLFLPLEHKIMGDEYNGCRVVEVDDDNIMLNPVCTAFKYDYYPTVKWCNEKICKEYQIPSGGWYKDKDTYTHIKTPNDDFKPVLNDMIYFPNTQS